MIKENTKYKLLRSRNYNYDFNKETGYFARWGKTKEEDPQFGLPEIADIEITTICNGINGKLCSFCYKRNSQKGDNMSLEKYEKILEKLPNTITQIAFGADSTTKSNPDIWKIMNVTRERGIIPNITVADLDDSDADNLVKYCGAVAVSIYDDKNIAYDAIEKLTSRGLKQVNIHYMISEQTYERAYEIANDIKTDHRLKDMNAIVFLSLKTKGRGEKGFTQLSQSNFNNLVKYCLDENISIGFDSCGCQKFIKSTQDNKELSDITKNVMIQSAEPCESSLFSVYIDVHGIFHPCSFSPNTDVWSEGIDVVSCSDFIKDIWYHDKVKAFRKTLLENKRNCPLYNI